MTRQTVTNQGPRAMKWWMSTIAIGLVLSTGCATLLKSKESEVRLNGPSGTEILVDGESAGQAPTTVTLSNKIDHEVVFKLADGQERRCRLTAGASTGWVVLSVLAGGVGWLIDWGTGNWRSLDKDTCNA